MFMTKTNVLLCATMTLLLVACTATRSTTTTAPLVQRVPAKFDFSPPSRANAGSTNITIAIVKPTYVGKNPEYFVPPFH